MDDHCIGIGNIKASLNNGGGHQNIDLTINKVCHDPFQLMLMHLSMSKGNHCIRHQFLDPCCHLINIRYTIVYIVHLAFSRQLSVDRFPDHFLIVFHYISLDRCTVHRRFFQHTHIPDPCKAHMQCPWDRCCSQSHNIYIFLQLLDLLFMSHTETLLLINDQKTQIFKLQILRKHSVGTDYNVHHTFSQVFQCLFLLGWGTETAQHINAHRKILHSLDKSIIMLLSQNGGWYQIHHLFAVLNCLKSCPQGDLCLSVTNITTDQPIHDLTAFHIFFHCLNGI